jgi:glutamine amidotransferase
MCRILYARAEADFAISELLAPFAELSRHSSEFQGHGWGCAWREGGSWRHYHDIRPIWEDDLSQFGSTRLLLVHARSAFRDEGIVVENNMPFSDGAEKIYNYIRRFDKGDKCAATAKAVDIIKKRSTYVRAMNLILSDGAQSCLSTNYSENTGYFQMHQKQDGGLHLVCSEPFAGDRGWTRIENNTTIAL